MTRGAPVYEGCGYAYGKQAVEKQSCGESKGTLQFIGDGIPESNPCKLPRGTVMYKGCGYLYASEFQRNAQCGSNEGTLQFIGDGL